MSDQVSKATSIMTALALLACVGGLGWWLASLYYDPIRYKDTCHNYLIVSCAHGLEPQVAGASDAEIRISCEKRPLPVLLEGRDGGR